MATKKTPRKSRKDGNKAAGRRSGTPRKNGVKDPFTEREGSPLAGGDSPPSRPYALTPVETLEQAVACAEWITKRYGETIGIVTKEGPFQYWGFASETEGWEMAVRRGTAEEVIREAIKRGLTQTGGLQLVTRDAQSMIPLLSEWLDLPVGDIAARVVGDIKAQDYSTGRIHGQSWVWAADDAYDALVTEKHFKSDTPPSYTNVCLPRTLSTFSHGLAADSDGVTWRISYNFLLLRVIAHYTREPVMVRAFMEETDPLPVIGELLGIEDFPADRSPVYAILVWAALGQDMQFLQYQHPDIFNLLPDNLDLMRQQIDRKLSPFSLGISRIRDDYTQAKSITSLWGRTFRWGGEAMGQVYEHRFMGSVRDLVDVLVVSLQQNLGEGVSVEEPEYSPTDMSFVFKGRVETTQEQVDLLKSAANLGNPLGVPLAPSIIIGD